MKPVTGRALIAKISRIAAIISSAALLLCAMGASGAIAIHDESVDIRRGSGRTGQPFSVVTIEKEETDAVSVKIAGEPSFVPLTELQPQASSPDTNSDTPDTDVLPTDAMYAPPTDTISESLPQDNPSPPVAPTVAPPAPAIAYQYNPDAQSVFFDLLNSRRAAAGVNLLTWDSALAPYALNRAQETAVVFDHCHPDGTPWYEGGCWAMNENLAAGYADPQTALDRLMESPDHAASLMNPAHTYVAIGFVCIPGGAPSGYDSYWCIMLG